MSARRLAEVQISPRKHAENSTGMGAEGNGDDAIQLFLHQRRPFFLSAMVRVGFAMSAQTDDRSGTNVEASNRDHEFFGKLRLRHFTPLADRCISSEADPEVYGGRNDFHRLAKSTVQIVAEHLPICLTDR
jgi:hypothetical protein